MKEIAMKVVMLVFALTLASGFLYGDGGFQGDAEDMKDTTKTKLAEVQTEMSK
ncbi:hypothetical protein IHV10_20320 [Fictibacillus sp. 5RED26]|jgi:hypothetical protein|uniref:hypothetical protein n=1 Tax=Fictibacillus sp. 5RED26 TaxID=2745876 RepID=UPI0018CD2F3E|nr:hypothetical protein [Fictibacillus sp. 5RED26]MBH0158733.1 hypothetical protein [Fictibacillus sp. 5RED26]